MSHFYVKSEDLTNYALGLQQINSVALPIAVQNSLNAVARDVKKRTLKRSTDKFFDVKKAGFFKGNSAFKTFNAKQFSYNVNKIRAEVGMTKSTKQNEKATEQIASQETGSKIKRSINPLGEKPKSTAVIDLLKSKPEIYDSSQSYPEGNSIAYIRRAQKAYRNGSTFLVIGKDGKKGRGALNKVTSIKKRKPTKSDPRKMIIKTKSIASYLKEGHVKLTKASPFLRYAAMESQNQILESEFIKEARKQVNRALKR